MADNPQPFYKESLVLTLIDLAGLNLTQKIISGEKVDQFCQAENITIKCRARFPDDSWELMLYVRFNVKRFEAGLILLPSSNCQQKNLFSKTMLRVFGKDHELCLEEVAKHYADLIKSYNLHEIT